MTESRARQLHRECWQLCKQKHYSRAVILAEALTREYPKQAESWYSFSYTLHKIRRAPEAVVAVDKALELLPGNADFLAHKAHCLISIGDFASAIKLAKNVVSIAENNPQALTKAGIIFQYCDELDAYLQVTEKVVNLIPDNSSALRNYSEALSFMGYHEKAEQITDRLLSLNPDDAKTHYSRSQIRKVDSNNHHIDELKACLSRSNDWRSQMKLSFALGKEHEDIGDSESAFYWFSRGGDLRTAHSNYDVQGDVDTMNLIGKTFTRECFTKFSKGYESEEPIFVLGLPRSGTTLMERILGGHSDVFAAGELRNFATELIKQIQITNPGKKLDKQEMVRASCEVNWADLGEAYVCSTRPRTGRTAYFVDKMPQNYLYIGLIAQALPRAKIILMHRDPMDSCYAMYKTLFGQAYPFTYNQQDLGQYYVAWKRLMDHWQDVLPERVYKVRYESLVTNTEQQVRDLLAYCGLSWQSQCLQFHERSAGVSTASASQVRQPVYRTSVGKWRQYKQQLNPLTEILTNAKIAIK